MTLRDELPSTESRARPRATPEQRAHGDTVRERPDRVFLESDARCAKSSPKNYNQYLFADAPRVAESLTRAVRDVRRSVDDERVALAYWLSRVRRTSISR